RNKRSRAFCRAVSPGGSNHGKPYSFSTPRTLSSSRLWESSALCTSGLSCAGQWLSSPSEYNRMHNPGPVRAARPALCTAEALLMWVVVSDGMPDHDEYVATRCSPESMTTETPWIVTEDSAIFVDRITLRRAAGVMA